MNINERWAGGAFAPIQRGIYPSLTLLHLLPCGWLNDLNTGVFSQFLFPLPHALFARFRPDPLLE
jgi:hypothetical protein